jgi:hypothetical protein
MATSLLEQLHFIHALVDSDPTMNDAANAHFLLIQSLLKTIIEQIEQQQADQLTAKRKETEA